MIKNLLFDMGNVLIRFAPGVFIDRLGLPEAEDRLALNNELFGSLDWVRLDRGVIGEDEIIRSVCARLPRRLHDAVETLARHWDEPPLPVAGMEALAGELADRGYELYLLTNAGPRHREYWPRYPVARFFPEERVFRSADYKLLKPESAFYLSALERFGLDAGECLFIDDNAVNAESAARLGIDVIVFHGADHLRRCLARRGLLPPEKE